MDESAREVPCIRCEPFAEILAEKVAPKNRALLSLPDKTVPLRYVIREKLNCRNPLGN